MTSLSILLVDDDENFRERMARALRDRGHDVRTAAGPDDAVCMATEDSPECAVVDLRMPGGSGLDVVSALRTIDPATTVVVLTGYGSIATAMEAVRQTTGPEGLAGRGKTSRGSAQFSAGCFLAPGKKHPVLPVDGHPEPSGLPVRTPWRKEHIHHAKAGEASPFCGTTGSTRSSEHLLCGHDGQRFGGRHSGRSLADLESRPIGGCRWRYY